MSNPSNQATRAAISGGPFAKRPRAVLVWILEFFTMYEVAGLQRLVCVEFRDAGQERIHERGGRKLFEEGAAYFHGLDHKPIDKERAHLLLQASRDAGCKIALVDDRMCVPNISDEEKQNILKDLKEIATSSPYHWVDFYIAVFYKKGWEGEEKKNQAVEWLERAVRKGNPRAMQSLGGSYHKGGFGLTQSDTKMNELLALAADEGHALARCVLGDSYYYGRGGLAVDFNRCVELWEQSANQGYVKSQTALAEIYHLGSRDGPPMTIPVDPQLCFRWCLAAAKQGDVNSMESIGYFYHTGLGVEQNDESSFEWFMKAAEKGDQHAQHNLGSCYENGRGVDVDLVQAMHWYQKSAAQGCQDSIDAAERLSQAQ